MKLCFLIIPRLLNPNVPTDIVKSISESSNWEHLNIWAQDSCNFGLSIAQYYLVLISPVVNLQGTFFCWKVGSVPKIYDIYCLSTRAKDMGNGIAMCTRPEKQKKSDSLPAITIFCFEVKKHQGRPSTNVYFGG